MPGRENGENNAKLCAGRGDSHRRSFSFMTPESQRIAIAEACGWKDIKQIGGGELWQWVGDPPNSVHHELIPDYLNDLNAMHEAEKVLTTENQREQYWIELMRICDSKDESGFNSRWICAHATASQRAEAFLLTLNLWKE